METRHDLENRLISRAGEDEVFRSLLLENPREAVRDETGMTIPAHIELTVHEEGRASFHMVLPASPRLSEQELESISGGSSTSDALSSVGEAY